MYQIASHFGLHNVFLYCQLIWKHSRQILWCCHCTLQLCVSRFVLWLLDLFAFLTSNRESDRVTQRGVEHSTWEHFLILTLEQSLIIKVHFRDIEGSRVGKWCLSLSEWAWGLLQRECSTQKPSWNWTCDAHILTPGHLSKRIHGDAGLREAHWKSSTVLEYYMCCLRAELYLFWLLVSLLPFDYLHKWMKYQVQETDFFFPYQ